MSSRLLLQNYFATVLMT